MVLKYLISEIPYDGVVTTSDLIAIGMIRQLQINGKKVPENIRVVGYDNVPLASFFIPALTTIAQPLEDICNRIVEMIFSDKDDLTKLETTFTPELIVRET